MLQTAGAWGALADGARALLAHVSGFNVRTLDTFAARCWSMLALAAEHGAPGEAEALTPALLAAYRTCCLRHDDYGQAVTLNLLLRTHVRASAFDAASKLLSKASFPEAASPAQLCRYLYYKGRVQAVLLDYSDALASLTQAVRKAPPSALGFRLTATKFALIAQLLTGAVPERATFAAPDMRAALGPYLDLTRAVRVGDLPAFRAVVARHADGAFGRDRTLTLAQRLETNVIKTGLRSLATAYARISFADVAAKLGLGSAADAEFLCAKVRVSVV
jgi:26S proteasome regulatory subunit N3